MDRLTVTLKTVTPLFLGGADPNKIAELRAPSIKGALRFWYRAIDPGYGEWEDKIFGSTEHGQGVFSVKVNEVDVKYGKIGDKRWHGTKIAYLGFGAINREETDEISANGKPIKKSITTRHFIEADSQFEISFLFHSRTDEIVRGKIEDSLWALLMLGGLGARSRRGFGSLMIMSCDKTQRAYKWSFNDALDYRNALIKFRQNISLKDSLPDFTCWSSQSRIVMGPEDSDGLKVLDSVSTALHDYRSYYGHNRASFVAHDKTLVLDFLNTGKIETAPLRAAFGLPHNYFFTKSLRNVAAEINYMDRQQKGRRASPMLLHIQGLSNGKACPVVIFFPAELIPAKSCIEISAKGKDSQDIDLPDNFSAIEGFLDRLVKVHNYQEVSW